MGADPSNEVTMAKSPAIRIAPDLLPAETRVEVENVRGDIMRAYDSLPEKLTPEATVGLRDFLQRTSLDGTPRVVLVAREFHGKRHLSSLVLGALHGIGLDGRRTLLVDFLVGNYALLEPVVAHLRGVAQMGNLRSQAQVVGALVPSQDLLRGAGFTSYAWQGHEILHLEAA